MFNDVAGGILGIIVGVILCWFIWIPFLQWNFFTDKSLWSGFGDLYRTVTLLGDVRSARKERNAARNAYLSSVDRELTSKGL